VVIRRIYKTLDRYFIQRKIPYGLISIRYLLPFQPQEVRQHQRWMILNFPKWPTILWLPLNLCLWLRWQCWYGPYAIYKAHQHNAHHVADREGIHPATQAWQLFYLNLLYTIPPSAYYHYQLYQDKRRKQRWQYVYGHELPGYHYAQSLSLDNNTIEQLLSQTKQLNDKQGLIEQLIEQGIPTTPVLKTLEHLSLEVLMELTQQYQSPVFIKPVQANQSLSAFKLVKIEQQCQIQPIGKLPETQPDSIETYCQQMSATGPWMVQAYLQNHPEIQVPLSSDEAVSLRYISRRGERDIEQLSSYIEMPYIKEGMVYYYPLLIDHQGRIEKGEQLSDHFSNNVELVALLDTVSDSMVIPCWSELEQYAKQAHMPFSAIRAIAWDFVVTPQGPVLLEGNVNWRIGVVREQLRKGAGGIIFI